MEVIKILPYHIKFYFKSYFLKRNPEVEISWYNDEKAKQSGVSDINKVISNPSQKIQIVSSYDAICQMCPRNQRGDNYTQKENTCTTYEDSDFIEELGNAKMLGIDDLIDKNPISAADLFERLKTKYDAIFTEKQNTSSQTKTFKEYFNVTPIDIFMIQNNYQ